MNKIYVSEGPLTDDEVIRTNSKTELQENLKVWESVLEEKCMKSRTEETVISDTRKDVYKRQEYYTFFEHHKNFNDNY